MTDVLTVYEKVLERDRHICQVCFAGNVEIHHIVPRSQFGKATRHLRDAEKNLVCLCKRCHVDAIEAHDRIVGLLRLMRDRYGYEYPEEKFRPWASEI